MLCFQIPYKKLDEAIHDLKKAHLSILIHFQPNFTESYREIIESGFLIERIHLDHNKIVIYTDHSATSVHIFLLKKIIKVYEIFSEKLSENCGFPLKLLNLP
jgi:hypothetical protein